MQLIEAIGEIVERWWLILNDHRWGLGSLTFKLWHAIAAILLLPYLAFSMLVWKPLLLGLVLLPIIIGVPATVLKVVEMLHREYEREGGEDKWD